jgi:hypothetical protein
MGNVKGSNRDTGYQKTGTKFTVFGQKVGVYAPSEKYGFSSSVK